MDNGYSDEFIGSEIEVIKSKNKDVEGAKGKVIDETKNSFTIVNSQNQEKRLLKKGSVFRINSKEILGERILRRPEERIKK
ncbi:ribonuclease P protein subunit [Candidatus Woesearchaeota archaeon]|nr:ribonuclease P protein subunit [Candidatus Woesearchaeota archaeon]